ncbi:unnamed protein product [Phytomonas sp. Hart1]|nr:unnamed protein product [Phytomonas sp. Hart1]|eukprot:CCW69847.1 unnamed protein product [Phytomonas sp. isolate Hart1]
MSKKIQPFHIDPIPSPKGNKQRPVAEEEDEEGEESEFDLVDVMNSMTPAERREVYALRGLWESYKTLRKELREQIGALKVANAQARNEIFAKRQAIVTGTRDITPEELQDVKLNANTEEKAEEEEKEDGVELSSSSKAQAGKSVKVVAPSDQAAKKLLEAAAEDPNGGIPNFWLTAMCNLDTIENMITERDRPALSFLTDISTEYLDKDPHKGVRLVFSFAPNEYFKNSTLVKTYRMSFNEEEGELEVEKIEGCDIEWASKANNLTVTIKEKKQRNKKTNQIRIVEREEPCMSFFNFFTAPKEEGEDDDNDEDSTDHEEEWEMDMEAGQELMEQIVPKAVFFYTGKSVDEVAAMLHSHYGDMDGEDEDEDEDEEEEEKDNLKRVGRFSGVQNFSRGGGSDGAGSRGRGGSTSKPGECKQQ